MPEPYDYLIISDTWRGISLHIYEDRYIGRFSTVAQAAQAARDMMNHDNFWPTLWLQEDRGEPQLYEDN